MKKLATKTLFLLLAIGLPLTAQAKLKKSDLEGKTKNVSNSQLVMNQIDFVSLYLSTNNIVYVPKLTEDHIIDVELNVLGLNLDQAPGGKESFVSRHVNTFSKTLKERLDFHVPKVGKNFDPNNDIRFILQQGQGRTFLAVWENGQWTWGKQGLSKLGLNSENNTKGLTECKKKCPALIRSKKKDENKPSSV